LAVSCSIGVALYPRDAGTAADLLRNANVAMRRAKDSGRSSFEFFTPEMSERATRRLTIERDLRLALERGELDLHYQPQIDMASCRVVGVEALLRWNHPKFGPISPASFIPVAEETGLIIPIGRWVLETACAQARSWMDIPGTDGMNVSVNLSPTQFRHPGLIADVAKAHALLAGTGYKLELELTEGMMMEDPAKAAALMLDLKGMGVRLAMDDFGTGYSSLAYLRSFPFDSLKIDQSFVAGLGRCRGTEAIVQAIIALSRAFKLDLVAEGVETPEHCVWLLKQGCSTAQGYRFSRPLEPSQLRTYLSPSRKMCCDLKGSCEEILMAANCG
jgi:EAL domain-containing protein (putative c-di-GMP-specific phosphodiesterase class I)